MFEVRWTNSSLEELATIWSDADATERSAITTATDRIDAVLSKAPHDAGESREDQRRVLFVPPIGIVFTLNDKAHSVRVLHVWRFTRKHHD